MADKKRFPKIEISDAEIVEQSGRWSKDVEYHWEKYDEAIKACDEDKASIHWQKYCIASDEYNLWMSEGLKRGVV